jgi:hypothetical protein
MKDKDMLHFVAQLIRLRNENPAFGNRGTFRFITANDETNHVMYMKTYEDTTLLFTFNNSDEPITVDIPLALAGKNMTNLLTGDEVVRGVENMSLVLDAHSFIVLDI